MEAIDLLREETRRCRFYEVSDEIRFPIQNVLKDFRVRFPEDSWDDKYLLEVEPNYIYGTKPVIKWGAVDTSVFQKKWGIALPDWMEEFYSQVTCGLLPMLNQIYIFSPEEAVENENEHRAACGLIDLSFRHIRFADGAEDGTGFSLRQRLSDDTWEIILSSYNYSAADFQSEEWENTTEKDKDINAWLLRMLRTDGHPLMIGNETIEPMPYKRLK